MSILRVIILEKFEYFCLLTTKLSLDLIQLKTNKVIKFSYILFLFSAFLGLNETSQAQCFQPIGNDTILCGPGSLTISANGITGFYNWYDSPTGPSFLDTGSTFITPLITVSDTFYVAEYDTGATSFALQFDGINNYAAIQDFNYNTTGITETTVEVWINTTNPNDQVIASYDRTEYWRLEVNGTGAGPGQIGFDIATDAGLLDFGGTVRVDDGLWHHVAAVFDNGTVSIYVDGVLDNSTSLGSTFGTGLARFGFLGVGSEADVFDGTKGPFDYFDGEMGNVRIWSVARTQLEIQQAMNSCFEGPQTGLDIVYRMNGSGTDDVITDYSGNQQNALMRSFTLPGDWTLTGPTLVTCAQCESIRDTVIVSIIQPTAGFLGNDTCIAGNSFTIDASSNYSAFLWQDNSTLQTFTTSTSGVFSVTVDTVGGCQGSDTITVFINPEPVGIDTNFCGPGDYQLRATGSNGLYRWYDDFNATTGIDTGRLDVTLIATDTFYVSSFDTLSKSNSLTFNPAALNYSYIENFSYASTSNTELTIQTWIKTTNENDQIIASYDRNEYWRLEINGAGAGPGAIGFDVQTNAGTFDFGGTIRIDDGNWHHIAAVYDNGTSIIYIDGIIDNMGTQGTAFGSGNTRFGFLGVGSEADTEDGTTGPNTYFDGSIADISIWSRALSQAEIQASIGNCSLGGENGLEVYYPFTNGAGTEITDRSGNNRNAILKNTFAGNAWNNSGPTLNGCPSECESTRDTVIALLNTIPQPDLGPDICASVPTTIDAGPNYTSYLWNTAATTQTITTDENNEGQFFVTVDSAGTPCAGSDTIYSNIILVPQGVDSNRCGPGEVELQVNGGSNFKWFDKNGNTLGTGSTLTPTLMATDTFIVSSIECDTLTEGLIFNGTTDYVALDMSYNIAGQIPELTVEAWVKTSFSSAGANDNWAIVDFDRSEYYNLYVLGDGRVGFSTEPNGGGAIDDFYSSPTTLVNDGLWHHLAAVYDGTDKHIYIDGNLVNSRINPHGGRNLGNGSTRFGFIGDGSEATTFNATRNNIYFEGEIAEVRIWNTARTAIQIKDFMQFCLDGSEPTLAAYYKMDDGVGSSTLTDYSGNNRNGTLFGMNTATAWVNTNNDIFCNCCVSDPDTAVATVFDVIDSNRFVVSCPSVDSSLVLLNAFGGTDSYDFKELSGEFAYSNSFSAGLSRRRLNNGGTYTIEIKDENGCLDTTSTIIINNSPTSIATNTSSGSCRLIDQNEFAFIVNGSNEVIVGVSSPSKDLGLMTATVHVESNPLNFNGEAYLGRHFVINSDTTVVPIAKIRFPLLNSELADLIDSANATPFSNDDLSAVSDLGVTKYNGPTEDGVYDPSDATSLFFLNQNAFGSLFGTPYFDVNTFGFSEFWPHASFTNAPLPIELKNFTVELNPENTVLISWSTYSEINNDYFTVEKTTNGNNWVELTRVKGKGNSVSLQSYSTIDNSPFSGTSYYRLKQTDFNGSYEYFEPKSIKVVSETDFNLYPNPSNGSLTIEFLGIHSEGQVELNILSLEGKVVYNSIYLLDSNSEVNQSFQIDASKILDNGIYIISLKTNNDIVSRKLIINK